MIAGQWILGKLLKLGPLAGFAPGLAAWKFVLLPVVIGVVRDMGDIKELEKN